MSIRTSHCLLLLAGLLGTVGPSRAQTCTGDCNLDGAVTVEELVTSVNVALGEISTTECEAADASSDGVVTVDELVAAVRNALVGCPRDTLAFVVATDFETGSFATIGLDEPRAIEPASPQRRINADAVARPFGDLLYVVNRFFGDNVQILDPSDDFRTTLQCSTGNGSNPQDIAFVDGDKAYVTALDATGLLIVDPSPSPDCSDFLLGSIDLSSFADEDGIPEMNQMAIVGNRLYVALQKLDRSNFFNPAGPGTIVVVDTTTDEIADEISLLGMNPFAATKGLTVSDGTLIVSQAGFFGVNDGGIERIDLTTGESGGFFVTEEALGGDLTDFVLVSDQLGYAIISAADFTNSVIRFDPSQGVATDAVLAGVEFISDIELNDRGEIFVADRTAVGPGIRILRAEDGTELTDAPLDVGLPPFEIVFLK